MKKRLITGVTLILVTLIAATTIILGFVKTDSKPEFNAPDEITFLLTTGQTRTVSNVEGVSQTEKELYNSLYEAYNGMFDFSILTGIFTGSLGGFQINESTNKTDVSGNKITFSYLENQTLTIDGEVYYSKYSQSKKFEYKTIEFSIVEEDAFSTLHIVVSLVDLINWNSFYAEITTRANTSHIYNVIHDFYNA